MLNEGNQIHNFISSSGSWTVINYGFDFLTVCGSGMFIPDPTFFHPGSRIRTVSIPDPGSSKNLSILTPNKAKKWFLSSWKIWSGLFIPDPEADFLASRIPGSKSTQSRIPDPQHCFLTNCGSGSGSTSQKVTVSTVPVPQHWNSGYEIRDEKKIESGILDPG